MFADENGDVAVLEPEQETPTPSLPIAFAEADPVIEEEDEKRAPEGASKWPEFINEIDNVYRSNRAHVFVLHGNVNDYPNNTGKKVSVKAPTATNIACRFTVPNGLVFATEDSLNAFREVLKSVPSYAGMKDEDLNAICQPKDLPNTLMLLNEYFKASAKRFALNQPLRVKLLDSKLKASEKAQAAAELSQRNEANLTVIWYDTKMCFANGQVSQLTMDRTPIAY